MNISPASFFKSLNIKIILYFIALVFIPLLIFSIMGYYLNKDMIFRLNLSQLKTINRSFVREFDHYLNYKKSFLIYLLEEYYTNNNGDFLFHQIKKQSKAFRAFAALELIQQDGGKKFYFKSEYETYPYIDYSFANNALIRAYFDPQSLQELVKSDMGEYRHYIYFLTQKIKISEERYTTYEDLDTVLSQLHENNAKSQLQAVITHGDMGVFYAGTILADRDLALVSQLNAGDFFAELDAFRNKILLANVLLATILFFLALFYSRRITTPIHKLIGAVQHIRHGNLDHQIKLETNDEIQILAYEFELMRQKLQESYQGMEEKIQLRTRELQEAQAQISHQEKMASLGLMAAGIAHEIGNPLTSISSMAQVIKRKSSDSKTEEYVTNILRNIERISRIVRELVDFSRPTSHKKSMVDINEIIKSAVGIIKYDRRSKKIQFILNLDPSLPHAILVGDHLLQVCLNILINAIDASEDYGDEIEVKSYHGNNKVFIEIRDQGCGIATDKLNKIFEPFYTTKKVGKGTGLGLTVSYGFVKKMGGEIKVRSTLEQGSIFTIVLPIKEEAEGVL
jgi:signal transduction histidine kinase